MRVVIENRVKRKLSVNARMVLEAEEGTLPNANHRLQWHIKELVFTISEEEQ